MSGRHRKKKVEVGPPDCAATSDSAVLAWITHIHELQTTSDSKQDKVQTLNNSMQGAARILSLESPDAWSFDGDAAAWEGCRVSTAEIEKIRRRFLISFGSCSFVEPIDDLRSLGLLE